MDPITREGIYFALLSGQWAADAAIQHDAAKYAARVRAEIIPELIHAARLKARFFQLASTGLLITALRRSRAVSAVMANLIAGRQEYAGLLLQLERLKIAEKIIDPLLRDNPDTKTLELASRYSRRQGDDQKALEFARIAVKRAPNDDLARFLLADLLAGLADRGQHAEARKILWEIAGKEGPFRQKATEALAVAPELSEEEQKRALQMLDALSPPNIR